jgi:hypothetical protein
MDHYQVKWKGEDGVVHYGIYRCPTKKKPGMCNVDDAVMPYYHEVPIKDLVDIAHGMPVFVQGKLGGQPGDEFAKFVNDSYEAADKLSRSLPEGILVGKLFSVGVGDGSAWYVVTKVGKTTAKVEWRGFCPDRYTDQVIGIGGSFPMATLRRMGVGRKPLFGPF